MKQIEVFVDSVYQNVGGNKEEIQELKMEMKSHLFEAVHELKLEGKSEQEAIEIAIARFGGEKELRSVIGELFKIQKVFAKKILITGLVFLCIASAIFGTIFIIENLNMREDTENLTLLFNSLEDKEVLSQDIKDDIDSIVQQSNHIYEIKVYEHKGIDFMDINFAQPDYQYEEEIWAPDWLLVGLNGYGEGDDTWHIAMGSRSFEGFATGILLLGGLIYWTLFAIWAIINAYHQKRLNIGWTLAFILFNVLGYLVFKLSKRFRIIFSMERVR
jgi:hypothetical protein